MGFAATAMTCAALATPVLAQPAEIKPQGTNDSSRYRTERQITAEDARRHALLRVLLEIDEIAEATLASITLETMLKNNGAVA